jgi:hypothetical protein
MEKRLLLDGHEIILYRTHDLMLTDKRVVVEGYTYPLGVVNAVKTRRVRYYLPLQLFRLLALAAVVLVAGNLVQTVQDNLFSTAVIVRFVGVIAAAGLFYVLVWLTPTHTIQIKSEWGDVNALSSGNVRHLRALERKIRTACENLERPQP